jgi:dTDP-4-dehydrorhamnose 3,5-epimerase
MRRLDTTLNGPALIAPTVHGDDRGFFLETYRRDAFGQLGIALQAVLWRLA